MQNIIKLPIGITSKGKKELFKMLRSKSLRSTELISPYGVYDLNTDFYAVEMSKTPAYIQLLKAYKAKGWLFKTFNALAKIIGKIS